eukprot:TRINITY_DN5446_c0_g1_i2.p1 TRINITY_DN5446_c0_g1~~TRINITY_DN5446_c0_g1_i2.p1  ORF type:complete len:341 (-),score=118.26 TRINITY_DN5446_c0_g1_i2:24-1046(-)
MFGIEGGKDLVDVIQGNSSIQTFLLNGTNIDPESLQIIDVLLQRNRGIVAQEEVVTEINKSVSQEEANVESKSAWKEVQKLKQQLDLEEQIRTSVNDALSTKQAELEEALETIAELQTTITKQKQTISESGSQLQSEAQAHVLTQKRLAGAEAQLALSNRERDQSIASIREELDEWRSKVFEAEKQLQEQKTISAERELRDSREMAELQNSIVHSEAERDELRVSVSTWKQKHADIRSSAEFLESKIRTYQEERKKEKKSLFEQIQVARQETSSQITHIEKQHREIISEKDLSISDLQQELRSSQSRVRVLEESLDVEKSSSERRIMDLEKQFERLVLRS